MSLPSFSLSNSFDARYDIDNSDDSNDNTEPHNNSLYCETNKSNKSKKYVYRENSDKFKDLSEGSRMRTLGRVFWISYMSSILSWTTMPT